MENWHTGIEIERRVDLMNTKCKKINFHQVSLRTMLEIMVHEVTEAPVSDDPPLKFYWQDGNGELLHERLIWW